MFAWRAFKDLGTCRPTPASPIPWTAIDAYAKRHDLEGVDFDTFEMVIRSIDRQYLELRHGNVGTGGA